MTEGRFKDWLETQPVDDKIVYLRYKYAHEDTWTYSKEILEVDMHADGYYIWANDWYEGQQDVEILGCISIDDVIVPFNLFTPADTPQQTESYYTDATHFGKAKGESTTTNTADTPQTEYDKYREKIRPHDPHKDWFEDEPQTDCSWGEVK